MQKATTDGIRYQNQFVTGQSTKTSYENLETSRTIKATYMTHTEEENECGRNRKRGPTNVDNMRTEWN